MKELVIAEGLALPLEVVTMTQAILARKRSGKSYLAQKLAEQLLTAGQQVVALDPTGAWWGLRSSADGTGPGFSVVVFGGSHADAPLDYRAGASLARAVVEHGFSAIFDVGEMGVDEQMQFGAEFCAELYKLNRSAMHLFMDEAHNWAAQKPNSRWEHKALGAVRRLVLQGGIRGIGFTMISQRTALVNKDVLSQVDILSVLRMSLPNDIRTVSEWLGSEVSPEFAKQVAASLPALPRGAAFIGSAPLGLGQKIQVAAKETFDSGATPKPGERRIEPKVLAPIDIQKLGTQIAESIREQEENSPEALRARIAELQRQVQTKAGEVSKEREQMLVEQIQQMETELASYRIRFAKIGEAAQTARALAEQLEGIAGTVGENDGVTLNHPAIRVVPSASNSFVPEAPIVFSLARPDAKPVPSGELGISHLKILSALAKLRAVGIIAPVRIQVALLAGYSNPKSGGFAQPMADLVARGLATGSFGAVSITPEGLKAAGPVQAPISNRELHAQLRDLLGAAEWKMLDLLIQHYPKAFDRSALAERTGYSNAKSGGFAGPMARLTSLGLAEVPSPGTVRGSDLLFIRGGRP
jgi:uncharacterized protein